MAGPIGVAGWDLDLDLKGADAGQLCRVKSIEEGADTLSLKGTSDNFRSYGVRERVNR
jgi:hypothetical protein